jgi:hypothetical protein
VSVVYQILYWPLMNLSALRLVRNHHNARQFRHPLRVLRAQSSTTAAQSSSLPVVVLRSPSPAAVAEQELDVKILSPQEINVQITQRAAEVRFYSRNVHYQIEKLPRHEATPSDLCAREQSRCSSSNSRRVWRMSWIPVQDGPRIT